MGSPAQQHALHPVTASADVSKTALDFWRQLELGKCRHGLQGAHLAGREAVVCCWVWGSIDWHLSTSGWVEVPPSHGVFHSLEVRELHRNGCIWLGLLNTGCCWISTL